MGNVCSLKGDFMVKIRINSSQINRAKRNLNKKVEKELKRELQKIERELKRKLK